MAAISAAIFFGDLKMKIQKLRQLYKDRDYQAVIKILQSKSQKTATEMQLLGASLIHNEQLAEGRKIIEDELRKFPDSSTLKSNVALVNYKMGSNTEALSIYNSLLSSPQTEVPNGTILNNMAVIYKDMGDAENAKSCYLKILNENPHDLTVLNNLHSLIDYLNPDERSYIRERLEVGLAKAEELPKTCRNYDLHAGLYFTRARACEQDQAFPQALDDYIKANKLKMMSFPEDPDTDFTRFDALKRLFNSLVTVELKPVEDRCPLFIIGMPRSGTTLIEQMLSMSPEVTALGELEDFRQALSEFGFKYDKEVLSQIRAKYLKRSKNVETKYFCDKMPSNFLWVSYILAAFPR